MAKISSFMRVTKQPATHGKKVDASPGVKKQHAVKEEAEKSDDAHIPTFIYKTVKYQHKQQKHEVFKETKTVVEYITKYFYVPKDFERNTQFGAYSGLTFETRLARAYSMGQLSLKKRAAAPKPICLTCATVGHTYKCCPDGF